jgi:hypothetical protein
LPERHSDLGSAVSAKHVESGDVVPTDPASGGLVEIAGHTVFPSQAQRDAVFSTEVSGQRPEQGAAAKFFAQQKTWAQGPYPAQ